MLKKADRGKGAQKAAGIGKRDVEMQSAVEAKLMTLKMGCCRTGDERKRMPP
ncbi:hypothetical protein Y888_09215 [Mixta calida B021323]|nr:hypothetical protein Y888_09215 [Mixta calida B021323]